MFTGIATWIAKSVLGGWLTKISDAFKWLFKAWYRLVIAALLAACLWLYVGKTSALAKADKWKRTAEQEMSLRIANEVAYKNAQKAAADLNKKQVESIKAQYAAIAEKESREYETRLADNRRSLALWLRSKAPPSASSGTGTSASPAMPGEPVQDPTEALVSVADLEIAADNYSQLVSLIEWAKSIGAVKPEQ